MTVSRIEQLKNGRGRVRLTLADASVFVLYPADWKELALSQPAEGEDLPEEVIARIREELLPLRAKKRAMHLLEKRPYTERRLRDKLEEGEYPAEAVEAALDYVRSYGYLDDLQYAKDYIAYRLQTHNRAKLTAALAQRGVDRHVIAEAFDAVYAECDAAAADAGTEPDASARDGDIARGTELALLQKELAKKRYDPETYSYEDKMRLTAALVRKGFDPALVREVVL